ncbi:MAG: signal peptide peptidase SppA [Deltaproteobacteria bacterium HGW-Deltaproteobacteria-19]|jgi:protease-4|nr:MAG: signal peptide peptidase SppA [Deltaproteobacteria bacterium HGW-Deltaproteobacteria-19]
MKRFYLIAALLALALLTACAGPQVKLFPDAKDPLKEFTIEGTGADKILLIPVRGVISDSPREGLITTNPSLVQEVVSQLRKAEKDKRIKAVLFKVNTPGGTITASDILYHEISGYRQRTSAKVVSAMMDIATSGGYYLSLPADLIMAHPTTLTGSVGVIFVQPKAMGLMGKIGLGVDVQKFGKNKDMGSPFRESTAEEQKLLQATVDRLGDRFVSLVKKHRKLDAQALAEMSTARIFLAEEALKLGMIDRIGYLTDAVKETKKLAGLPDDARVVVYRRDEYPDDNLYNVAAAASGNTKLSLINIELPEILNLTTGFYYLWPGAIGGER